MKKLRDWLSMGYVVQMPVVLFVVLLVFVIQFFDSFYNRFFLERLIGRQIPGAGFLLSVVIALLVGIIAEAKHGWKILSWCLNKIPFGNHIARSVEGWKKFRELAREHGVVLAPYYRDKSGFWPGVITGILPKEGGGHLVTIVFADFPLPKPLLLSEDDTVYTKLTGEEAFAYILSGGLGLRISGRTLKERRLKELIASSLFENNAKNSTPT